MEKYRPQPEENKPKEIKVNKELELKKIEEIWNSLALAKESNSQSLREYPQVDYLMEGKKVGFDFSHDNPKRVSSGMQRLIEQSRQTDKFQYDKYYLEDYFSGMAGISISELTEEGETRRDIIIKMKQGNIYYGVIDYLITNKTDNPPITPEGPYNIKADCWPVPNIQQPISYYKNVYKSAKDADRPLPYQQSPLRDFKPGELDEIANIAKKMSSQIRNRGCYMGS